LSDSAKQRVDFVEFVAKQRVVSIRPRLFYWHREGGRPGEIDYVIQLEGRVDPVEIKSGTAGAMKSLHQFMADGGLEHAVRIDRNPPSVMEVDVATTQADRARYTLLSIPPYLLHRLPELFRDLASRSRRRKRPAHR